MDILVGIKNIILHIIRRLLQIILQISLFFICAIIYLVTYEPNTFRRVTVRKIRRIKIFTKIKVYLYKHFSKFWEFMHDDYLKKIYNKFYYLND